MRDAIERLVMSVASRHGVKCLLDDSIPCLALYDGLDDVVKVNPKLVAKYLDVVKELNINEERFVSAIIHHELMHRALHEESSKVLLMYKDVESARGNVEAVIRELEHYCIMSRTPYRDVEHAIYRLWLSSVSHAALDSHLTAMSVMLRLACGISLGFITTEEASHVLSPRCLGAVLRASLLLSRRDVCSAWSSDSIYEVAAEVLNTISENVCSSSE